MIPEIQKEPHPLKTLYMTVPLKSKDKREVFPGGLYQAKERGPPGAETAFRQRRRVHEQGAGQLVQTEGH